MWHRIEFGYSSVSIGRALVFFIEWPLLIEKKYAVWFFSCKISVFKPHPPNFFRLLVEFSQIPKTEIALDASPCMQGLHSAAAGYKMVLLSLLTPCFQHSGHD